jgi:hypothetical protein
MTTEMTSINPLGLDAVTGADFTLLGDPIEPWKT